MKFSLEATSANQIQFYDDTQVIISPEKQTYPLQLGSCLIVTPDQIITDSKIGNIMNLSDQNIAYLQNLEPEILIFTAGLVANHPLVKTQTEFAKKSIGVEYMTMGAACRTYNLLVLEGRQVALIISLNK